MGGERARVSIDVWHTTVCATLDHNPTIGSTPLVVNGELVVSSTVVVGDDGVVHAGRDAAALGVARPELVVRLPGQHLFSSHLQVGATTVDTVDLPAATLALFAAQAKALLNGGPPVQVVICRPSNWVPRQEEAIRLAARRAGLATPTVLDGAEAILRDQLASGVAVPVGAVIVVCRLDATVGEVVMLRHGADTAERLAVRPLGEIGEASGVTLVEQAAAALADALPAAEVTGEQVGAVFCQVPEQLMAPLAAALTAAAGLQVQPVLVDRLSAARGGLYESAPTRPARRRRWGLLHSLGGMAAGGVGAAVLIYQVFNGSEVYEASSTGPELFVTQWVAWGLAPVLGLLALVSAAYAAADVRARRPAPGPTATDRRLGTALTFAAAFAVAGAAMLALIGASTFEVKPATLLTWTLGGTVVVAAAVALAGGVIAKTAAAAGDRDRLRFPVEATVLAAVSTVAVVGAYTAVPIDDRNAWWTMEHAGAVGMGLAVAYLLTRRRTWLLAFGLLLGGPATYAISLDTVDAIGTFLIGAICLWWLVALIRLAARVVGPLLNPATNA